MRFDPNFLNKTNLKNRWEPYPGSGIVMCIAKGWPSAEADQKPLLVSDQDEELFDILNNFMSDDAVQDTLYQYCGEARDMDIYEFREWLYWRYKDEDLNLPKDQFKALIVGTVAAEGQ